MERVLDFLGVHLDLAQTPGAIITELVSEAAAETLLPEPSVCGLPVAERYRREQSRGVIKVAQKITGCPLPSSGRTTPFTVLTTSNKSKK